MWWTVHKYNEWNFSDYNIPSPIYEITYRDMSKSRTAAKTLTVAGVHLYNVTAKLMEYYIFHTACIVLYSNKFFRYPD